MRPTLRLVLATSLLLTSCGDPAESWFIAVRHNTMQNATHMGMTDLAAEHAEEWAQLLREHPDTKYREEAQRIHDDTRDFAAIGQVAWRIGEDPTELARRIFAYLRAHPEGLYLPWVERMADGIPAAYLAHQLFAELRAGPDPDLLVVASQALVLTHEPSDGPVQAHLGAPEQRRALFLGLPEDVDGASIALGAGRIPASADLVPYTVEVEVTTRTVESEAYLDDGGAVEATLQRNEVTVHLRLLDEGTVVWEGEGVATDPPLPSGIVITYEPGRTRIGNYEHTADRDARLAAGRALGAAVEGFTPLPEDTDGSWTPVHRLVARALGIYWTPIQELDALASPLAELEQDAGPARLREAVEQAVAWAEGMRTGG